MQQEKETSDTQQKKEKKSSRPKAKRTRLYMISGIIFSAVVILYFLIGLSYQNVFFPGTIVNGINVSGLNPSGGRRKYGIRFRQQHRSLHGGRQRPEGDTRQPEYTDMGSGKFS